MLCVTAASRATEQTHRCVSHVLNHLHHLHLQSLTQTDGPLDKLQPSLN